MKDARAVDALIAALRDEDFTVRSAAAVALGHRVVRIPVQVMDTQRALVVEQLARIRAEAERRSRRW